jgi:hypothetical protein
MVSKVWLAVHRRCVNYPCSCGRSVSIRFMWKSCIDLLAYYPAINGLDDLRGINVSGPYCSPAES